MSADVSVRLAWPEDAAAIAECQVAAWRVDYRPVVDEQILASLDVHEVGKVWASAIGRPRDARVRILVALERATVRGFSLVHPSPDPDGNGIDQAEVGEFVIDPDHRARGHGSRLIHAAVDTMRADNFSRARWWLSTDDDALRSFVTATGWQPDGAHREVETETGTRVKQVRLHTDLSDN